MAQEKSENEGQTPSRFVGTGEAKMSFSQKATLVCLIVIGFSALVLGSLNFFHSLRAPFGSAEPSGNSDELSSSENLGESSYLEGLKTMDTDGDGLSDYDELYVYNTSPYLEDTDSDGYSDKMEIEHGYDPNSPAGTSSEALTSTSTKEEAISGSETSPSPFLEKIGEVKGLEILRGEASVESLRQTLKEAGMSEEILSQIDDETLKEMYKETIKESKHTNATQIDTNVGTGISGFKSNYENFTPSEIRKVLKESGMSEEMLSQIDDKTLKEIFLKAMEESNY